MLLFNAAKPNPRAVRMFLLEKNLQIPMQEVDANAGENRKPPYLSCNPAGQVPTLRLDSGFCLAETGAICQYLEEIHPCPPLIGTTAEERAETRMWQRRVELNITEHLYAAFHYGEAMEIYKTRFRVLPEAVPGLKALVQDNLRWIDGLIEGRSFIVPDRFTIADIVLYCALDFGAHVGQPMDPALPHLTHWFRRIDARPSATASLHPSAAAVGMRF